MNNNKDKYIYNKMYINCNDINCRPKNNYFYGSGAAASCGRPSYYCHTPLFFSISLREMSSRRTLYPATPPPTPYIFLFYVINIKRKRDGGKGGAPTPI